MRVIVIGGTGHVGTFLIPRLVNAGHEVIVVSRGQRSPYESHDAWQSVKQVAMDRDEAERKNDFGKQILQLAPDVVIDMICFTLESAKNLVESLRGHVQHFLHCGTIWVHGHSIQVPTDENQSRQPFGEYGINKAAIEDYLLKESRQTGFPATILHPGHIVGPGWIPLNPAGNFNVDVFKRLALGQEVLLPNIGMETVHHVHADDVAQSFMKAIATGGAASGESFHVVSPQALSLKGYAMAMAGWFEQEAMLKFLGWNEWKEKVSENDARATWDHIAHSPNCSIDKARRILGYAPTYSSLQAIEEAVTWLIRHENLLGDEC